MKSFISLTLTFFLALLLPFVAQSDLVSDTCKNTPLPQLCLSTLRQDPRSKITDTAGLGLILVNAVKAKTTTTLSQIKKLVVSNPQLKGPLNECAQVYNSILIADIPSATQALTFGDPKFAESAMVDAGIEADSCEKSFKNGSRSPLSGLNRAVHDLSDVATTIIRMLL